MPKTVPQRNYPELGIDLHNHTVEDLKSQYVHIEGDLYYIYIHYLEGYIKYVLKTEEGYQGLYISPNKSRDREKAIAIAKTKAQEYLQAPEKEIYLTWPVIHAYVKQQFKP